MNKMPPPRNTSRQGGRFLASLMAVALAILGGRSMSWAAQPAASAVPSGTGSAPGGRGASGSPARVQPLIPATASVEPTYESREGAAKSLETFRGGEVVIIGSTTVLVILLVLLILVVL